TVAAGAGNGGADAPYAERGARADVDLHRQVVATERRGGTGDQVDLGLAGTAQQQRRLAAHADQAGAAGRIDLGDDARRGTHHPNGTNSVVADRTQFVTAPAPGSSTRDKNTVGASPRLALASRAITARSAPTSGARSV